MDLRSRLRFLAREPDYERIKPYGMAYGPPEGLARNNIVTEAVDDVSIHDLRNADLHYGKNGIEILNLETQLEPEEWLDQEKVEGVYLFELRDCLKTFFGASHVHVFEYVIRKRDSSFPLSTGGEYEHGQPVVTAHIDYTPADVVSIVRQVYGDEADEMLSGQIQTVK